MGNFDLDESENALPVSEQIISALVANAGKGCDLFRSWDRDGDSIVTRAEFHRAMGELGLECPAGVVDDIFSRWDTDGGGQLTLAELTKILRAASTISKNVKVLRKLLGRNGIKVIALFREWDANGDPPTPALSPLPHRHPHPRPHPHTHPSPTQATASSIATSSGLPSSAW